MDVPFSNEAMVFFESNGMELLQHRSRWGGAVHFALAASTKNNIGSDVLTNEFPNEDEGDTASSETESISRKSGIFKTHIKDKVGKLTNSYIPTASMNTAILKEPSFENAWYAVAFPWQIDGYHTPVDAVWGRKEKKSMKPFSTRLWGEPLVIYRDSNGDLVSMTDVCPHRSAPLSMGTIENDELVCMYHGWRFGEKGECVGAYIQLFTCANLVTYSFLTILIFPSLKIFRLYTLSMQTEKKV